MPIPVRIDLRNLTQAHVALAMDGLGLYLYSSPCIIGTLMTPEERARLDSDENREDEEVLDVAELSERGLLEMPDDQLYSAIVLQNAYDSGMLHLFQSLASPWVAALAPEPQSA